MADKGSLTISYTRRKIKREGAATCYRYINVSRLAEREGPEEQLADQWPKKFAVQCFVGRVGKSGGQ